MAPFERVVACAIMKDEEPTLMATLQSVRECLGERLAAIVIHDTGSTDQTNELAVENGCEVTCRLFDDFSSARNACLDEAEFYAQTCGAEWLLMFSGGARLTGTFTPGNDTALSHYETQGHGVQWIKIGPIRVGSGLRYAGRTHECIDIGKNPDAIPFCGLTVSYQHDAGDKTKRWELDLELLKDDMSTRGRYYYAQTLDSLKRWPEAFHWYAHRASLQGFEEERRQAVVNAVRTAPTMFFARMAIALASDCPDVYLEAARREQRARFVDSAHTYAKAALAHLDGKRCLFRVEDLVGHCERILAWGRR